jgi:MYXO-CTERM domain-containing protein
MSNRTKKNCAVLACTLSAAAASMSHAAITQVDYSAVVSNTSENFSGFASGGSGPRNTVVQGNGLSFGERFAGQQLGTQTIDFPGFVTASYDVLSGSPTSVLTLEAGSADRNLWIGDTQTQTGFVIAGCGPNGSAFGPSGVGHGSVAVLFDADQSQLGFRIGGQNGSTGIVSFFRRDGSLIETLNLSLVGVIPGFTPDLTFGFLRDGAVADIAGFSITHNDFAGIYMDDFIFSSSVPAPGAIALLGLAGLAGRRRR